MPYLKEAVYCVLGVLCREGVALILIPISLSLMALFIYLIGNVYCFGEPFGHSRLGALELVTIVLTNFGLPFYAVTFVMFECVVQRIRGEYSTSLAVTLGVSMILMLTIIVWNWHGMKAIIKQAGLD